MNSRIGRKMGKPGSRCAVLEDSGPDLRIPVMPISHTVLFPGAVIPLVVFEPGHLELVDSVCGGEDLQFGLVFAPPGENLELSLPASRIGTLAQIIRHRRSPKGEVSLMVQGVARLRIGQLVWEFPFPLADTRAIPSVDGDPDPALRSRVLSVFDEYLEHCAGDIEGLRGSLSGLSSLDRIVDLALACLPGSPPERQKLLETLDPRERAEGLIETIRSKLREKAEESAHRPPPDPETSRN
jgi:ATP-dependent Lon protease